MTGAALLVGAHASAAGVCLLLGGYQLRRRAKGDRTHRLVGWTWTVGMLFVATSSFAIRDLRDGRLSLLHVLSVVTLVSLVIGIVAARLGSTSAHRASMRGSWIGLAGAFIAAAAVPDRLLPSFTVAHPLGALTAAAVVVLTTAAIIGAAHLACAHTPPPTPPARGAARRQELRISASEQAHRVSPGSIARDAHPSDFRPE